MTKAKRLVPKPDTLRQIFLKSGNLCAFPKCSHLMMNADGVFIGQICHIEVAEEGGERFNPAMTNEQRRLRSIADVVARQQIADTDSEFFMWHQILASLETAADRSVTVRVSD